MMPIGHRSGRMEDREVAQLARRPWTLDEFLAFDDGTDTRYQLFDGQIVAMAPASGIHGALVMRTRAARSATLFDLDARSLPRRASSRPSAPTAGTRPTLRSPAPELTGQQFIAEPVLIVEVLSPSTAATDRDRKLPDYRTIPSLQDILVVSSTEPRIEHFRRDEAGWKIHDLRGAGTLSLQAFDLTLDLAELYRGLELGGAQAQRLSGA